MPDNNVDREWRPLSYCFLPAFRLLRTRSGHYPTAVDFLRVLFFSPSFQFLFFTGHTTKTSIGKQTKKKMELSSANQRKIFEVGSFAAVASISANLEAPFSHYGVNSLLPRSCSMAVVPERGRSRFFLFGFHSATDFSELKKKTNSWPNAALNRRTSGGNLNQKENQWNILTEECWIWNDLNFSLNDLNGSPTSSCLKTFLNRIGAAESNLCSCGEAETVEHFLFRLPEIL